MKKLKLFIGFILLSFSLSCTNDEELNYEPQTILDIIESNQNYSTLADALQKTGLTTTLDGSNSNDSYTLYAPNNMAFDSFLSTAGFSSLDDVPVDVLEKVLLNHVMVDMIRYSAFETGYYKTAAQYINGSTMNNLSMHIEQVNMRVTLNGESRITQGNVFASNGIIHAIDRVIPIPSIVTFAKADKNLEVLLSALTRSDLTTDFPFILGTDLGTSPAPFTVFAPVNQAFIDLFAELNLTSLSESDDPTLKATLT